MLSQTLHYRPLVFAIGSCKDTFLPYAYLSTLSDTLLAYAYHLSVYFDCRKVSTMFLQLPASEMFVSRFLWVPAARRAILLS